MTSIINLFDGTLPGADFKVPDTGDIYNNKPEIKKRIKIAVERASLKTFKREVFGDAYDTFAKKTTALRSVLKVGIAPRRNKIFTPPYNPVGTPQEKKKLYFSNIFLNFTKTIYENATRLGFKLTYSSTTLKDMEFDAAVSKDYFLVIWSALSAFLLLYVRTLYILTSLSVLLQCLATHLATYMIFIARFGVGNLSMLHILSFFYVVSASTNQFFHQYATWQIVVLHKSEPKDKLVNYMKTAASSVFFIMLSRLAAFLPLIILPYGVLKSLAVLNCMSIVLVFILGLFYVMPTLLMNLLFLSDKLILCCKCAPLNCLKTNLFAKIFGNVFYHLVSKQFPSFCFTVLSLMLSCSTSAVFATYDFKAVIASEVKKSFLI